MGEGWLARAAEHGWEAGGGPIAPPRDLSPVIRRPCPLRMVTLPARDRARVERWGAERSVPSRVLCQNRARCGCIIAARGDGMRFIDAHAAAAEHRFTVAHEVAHVLLDDRDPRQEAMALLGTPIVPVLDGARAPPAEERIHAILGRVKLGFSQDMMPRTAQGRSDQGAILRAADRADRLAREGRAPAADGLAAATTVTSTPWARARALTELLEQHDGVPLVVARADAASLAQQTSRPSVAEWVGR